MSDAQDLFNNRMVAVLQQMQMNMEALRKRVDDLELVLAAAQQGKSKQRETRHRRTYEAWEKVQELSKLGMSVRSIASNLGIPAATVYKYKNTPLEQAQLFKLSQSEEQSE